MNGVKIVGIFVALVVAAIAVAIVVLISTDWSEYEDPIVAAVEESTGRKLQVDGALAVSIGLTPAVSVDGVTFQNAQFGTRPEMATLEHFTVRLKLLPLLTGRVEVAAVELSGLDLILETDAAGTGNWVFSEGAPAEPTGPDTPAEESGPLGIATVVRSISIADIRLVYRDGQTGEEHKLELERLEASMPDAAGPLELLLRGGLNEEIIELDGSIEGIARVLDGGALGLLLALRAGGATVNVQGSVGDPLAGTGLDLRVVAEGESLAGFSGLAGSALPDLGPYRLALQLTDESGIYHLNDLAVRMGGSEISGAVSANVTGERPEVAVTLASKRIDLADFQDENAPSEPAEETSPSPASASSSSSSPVDARVLPADALPLDGLHAANARVRIEIDELIANGISVAAVELGAELSGGRLAVEPLAAKLAGGVIRGGAVVNASRKLPSISARLGIDGVEVGALLSTFEVSDLLKGAPIDLNLDVAGSGASLRAIAASLNGSLGLTLGTGTVESAWAELILSDLGSTLSGASSGDRTALNCALMRFDVTQGVASAQQFAVDTKGMVLFGSGNIDLRDERLALRFDPLPKSANATAAAPPAVVGGTFAAPAVQVDTAALVAQGIVAGLQYSDGGKVQVERIETSPGLDGCRELVARRSELLDEKKPSNTLGRSVEEALGDDAPPGLGNAVQGLFDAFGK